jgi:hypothetical protein
MRRLLLKAILLLLAVTLGLDTAQGQAINPDGGRSPDSELQLSRLIAQSRHARQSGFSLMPSYRNLRERAFFITPMSVVNNQTVFGSGTVGMLTRWTGFTNGQSLIGNSTIFEDQRGRVGVGTETPTSRLTVAGLIETINPGGGIKYPDGTVQTTAGIAPSQVVRSVNGLMGDLSLVPGSNITITPSGNTLTIASTASGLGAVAHDATLAGLGTTSSPLRVNVPLILSGSAGSIIQVANTAELGFGVVTSGGSNGAGVIAFGGESNSGVGGDGMFAQGGDGNSGGTGIFASGGFGEDGATLGQAGSFFGHVMIRGNLEVAGTKNFKIDHPLDPENKYLLHAAIESSEVLNLYTGNVVTDNYGEAVVQLPEWFEAVNRDFRYQLTVIGTFAQAIVAEEINGNRFTIRTNGPNVKVSWQVTGVRSDPTARKFKFAVEEEKPERERDHYLNPDAYGQPEERSVLYLNHPEIVKQRNEVRERIERRQR